MHHQDYSLECTMVENFKDYSILYGLTQISGILLLILVSVWTGYYRGGFAWTSNPKLEFNWHPLLMVISLIFLNGNALLVYRTFRYCKKITLKIIHALLHGTSLVLVCVSLKAVFDSHNLAPKPIPNMYSLHSWLGMFAVLIFFCQWFVAVNLFFCPSVCPPIRKNYLGFHIFFGLLAFILSGCAVMTGTTEKAIFTLKNKYATFPIEGILINFIGLVTVFFVSSTTYLVTKGRYKRQPLPEDTHLLRQCHHDQRLIGVFDSSINFLRYIWKKLTKNGQVSPPVQVKPPVPKEAQAPSHVNIHIEENEEPNQSPTVSNTNFTKPWNKVWGRKTQSQK